MRETKRWRWLAGLGLAAALAAGSARAESGAPAPFSLVVLPDTQSYVVNQAGHDVFLAQTRWIRDQREARNIVFALHVGDVVAHAPDSREWIRAAHSMGELDGAVPYVVVPGNHDGISTRRDTRMFNRGFPLKRFTERPSFGGVYDAEPHRMDNSYHRFRAGGLEWLILALEFGPRDAVLDWANRIVADHPDHVVIVLTHAYLFPDGTLHDARHPWSARAYAFARGPGGANDGSGIWEKLVRRHANIRFVVNGHAIPGEAGRRIATGDRGNRIVEMVANYQELPPAESGFLRILSFDPAADRLRVETYSPHLGKHKTDDANRFELELGLFGETKAAAIPPPAP